MHIRYIDAHCHIQFEQYAQDDEELVERMKKEGVAGIIVGVDAESSRKAVALAQKHKHLYASIGLHPNHAAQEVFSAGGGSASGGDIEIFRELAKNNKVVAIGECGLDYYRLPTDETAYSAEATKARQKEVLREHFALATELDKPLIIHARPSKGTQDAYHDLIEILKEEKIKHPKLRGDIHFFVGGITEARELIALGFTISFTAVITFTRDYDEVIKSVPLTSILSETDAPYVAPANRRGERNDPLAAIEVVTKIAEIRGETLETVRAALLANAKRLFTLKIERFALPMVS